jgi:hypothetical protein
MKADFSCVLPQELNGLHWESEGMGTPIKAPSPYLMGI